MYNIFRILIGVPDYSSSSLFLNEEEAISPPPDKQNTPGILYNMYRRCNDGSALNLDDFFFFRRMLFKENVISTDVQYI